MCSARTRADHPAARARCKRHGDRISVRVGRHDLQRGGRTLGACPRYDRRERRGTIRVHDGDLDRHRGGGDAVGGAEQRGVRTGVAVARTPRERAADGPGRSGRPKSWERDGRRGDDRHRQCQHIAIGIIGRHRERERAALANHLRRRSRRDRRWRIGDRELCRALVWLDRAGGSCKKPRDAAGVCDKTCAMHGPAKSTMCARPARADSRSCEARHGKSCQLGISCRWDVRVTDRRPNPAVSSPR